MREFNTKVAEGNYSITFNTDDRKAFEKVQELCRRLIDEKEAEKYDEVNFWENLIKEFEESDTYRIIKVLEGKDE